MVLLHIGKYFVLSFFLSFSVLLGSGLVGENDLRHHHIGRFSLFSSFSSFLFPSVTPWGLPPGFEALPAGSEAFPAGLKIYKPTRLQDFTSWLQSLSSWPKDSPSCI